VVGVNEQCGRQVTVLDSLAGRALLIDWDGIQLGSGASVQVRGERVDLMRGRGDQRCSHCVVADHERRVPLGVIGILGTAFITGRRPTRSVRRLDDRGQQPGVDGVDVA
jgi:hypothetical protein